MDDQRFHFQYVAGTGEILLHARYPAGHEHTTSFKIDELETLLANGREVARQYRS